MFEKVETRLLVIARRLDGRGSGTYGVSPRYPEACPSGGWMDRAEFPDFDTALSYAKQVEPLYAAAIAALRAMNDARRAVVDFNAAHTKVVNVDGSPGIVYGKPTKVVFRWPTETNRSSEVTQTPPRFPGDT